MINYFDSKISSLENGVKIVTTKKSTGLFCINLGIKVGSLYEKANERGISHIIEHMLFKGTNKRDNDSLNSEFEEAGAEYNAYTDYHCTVCSISALKDEMGKCMDLLSDMIMNSKFDKDELEKEKNVILAEIRTSKDDIEDYSFRKVNEYSFKKSPLKYDIIGDESTVKKLKKQDIIDFYKKFYVPNNCYISVVSPFEHEDVVNMINKYFRCWERHELEYEKFIIEDNNCVEKIEYKNDIEQSTLTYLYTFNNLSKMQELALRVLNHKLGESTNSILFRELREKSGLAYDAYTVINLTKKIKLLYIYTSVDKNDIISAKNIIDDCINNILNNKIKFDERTINIMRKVIKTSIVTTVEDTCELCSYVLTQFIEDDDIYDFDNDIKNLDNINEKDIIDVGRIVFNKPAKYILTTY